MTLLSCSVLHAWSSSISPIPLNMSMFFRPSAATKGIIPNPFLRKNRKKWPHPPYKTKWDTILNQQKALQNLKHLASSSPPPPQQQQQQTLDHHNSINPPTPFLLYCLINSFKNHDCEPTPIAYHFIIKTLVLDSHFSDVDLVLTHLEKGVNFDIPEWIFMDLIRVYGEKGMFDKAMGLFFRIPRFRCVPTVLSLNLVLRMLCRDEERIGVVPRVLIWAIDMNVRMDESSVSILIEALCRFGKVDYAIRLLNCGVDEGLVMDRKVYSLILSALCRRKGTACSEVLGFLGEMKRIGFRRDEVDFSNVIRFLVKQGKGTDALDCLSEMKREGLKPDIACYNIVLRGLVEEGEFVRAEELFDEILLFGLIPNLHTYNVYIAGLCKQKNVEAGYEIISCMEQLECKPDSMTYNMVFEGFCKAGESNRMGEVWKEMKLKRLLNFETYLILVCSLIQRCKIPEACKLFDEALMNGFVATSSKIDEVIFMFSQGGFVLEASQIVEKMLSFAIFPGTRAWEALILELKLNSSFITIESDELELLGNDLSGLLKVSSCN